MNNEALSSSRLRFLDDMRAIAIIMVVGVHVLSYAVELPPLQKDVIQFIVATIAVPIFFLADGFLLSRSATRAEAAGYIEYIKKSSQRLLIPWVAFTVLYAFARYIFERTGFLEEKIIVGVPFQEVLVSAYASVYAGQLYFLLSLFLIRLCYPLTKKIVNIRSFASLVLIFLLYSAACTLLLPVLSQYPPVSG